HRWRVALDSGARATRGNSVAGITRAPHHCVQTGARRTVSIQCSDSPAIPRPRVDVQRRVVSRPKRVTRTMTKALLVIDVQRGLCDNEPRPFEADAVVDRINDLAERARRANAPVIFVQHEAANELQHGSDSWQLERRLVVKDGDTRVRKATPDSFLRTELA